MKQPAHSPDSLWPPVLEAAVRLAARSHYRHFRKQLGGSNDCSEEGSALSEDCIPYVTHLTGTAIILARSGAGPELIAAGLLHDLLEDVPEAGGEDLIRRATGERVLELVLAVTEEKQRLRPASESWEERKDAQLRHLQCAEEEVVLLKAADALHNVLSLIADLEAAEDRGAVWDRFNAPPEAELRYYRRLSRTAGRRLPGHPVALELETAVRKLHRIEDQEDRLG